MARRAMTVASSTAAPPWSLLKYTYTSLPPAYGRNRSNHESIARTPYRGAGLARPACIRRYPKSAVRHSGPSGRPPRSAQQSAAPRAPSTASMSGCHHEASRGSTTTRTPAGKQRSAASSSPASARRVGGSCSSTGPSLSPSPSARGQEPGHRLGRLAQPPDVGEVAAGLDREHEPGRGLRRPTPRSRPVGQAVERAVHLDRGELAARSARASAAGQPGRVERAAPVRVLPARGTDPRHVTDPMHFGQEPAPNGRSGTIGWVSIVEVPTPARPLLQDPVPRSAIVVLAIGVVVPFVALLAAVPVAWGWGLNWVDVAIGLSFYLISGFGITVGFHRYLTHGSFKAKRWLRVTLAVAGALALEGHGHPVGGRPPAPPRVQRHGGRPALAVAVRRSFAGLAKGLWLRALRLAVPPGDVQPGAVRPGPARRPRHPPGRQAVPGAGAGVGPGCRPRSAGWSPGRGGARCPRSSGPAWSGSRCCTTSPGRSTRSATCTASARSQPARRPGGELLAARDALVRRELAQPRTTPTRPARATAFCVVRWTCRPG